MITVMSIFSGRYFPREVILWAVRWYRRFGFNYRGLEELMTERGVPIDHTLIYRWAQAYASEAAVVSGCSWQGAVTLGKQWAGSGVLQVNVR